MKQKDWQLSYFLSLTDNFSSLLFPSRSPSLFSQSTTQLSSHSTHKSQQPTEKMAPVPSPEVRANIAAKIDALILAVEKNPDFKRTSSSGGLYHVWDFAHRTQYMLFEVDGIRQEGYEFKHAGQIKISESFLLFKYVIGLA